MVRYETIKACNANDEPQEIYIYIICKKQKYHTVVTVPRSNSKMIERDKIDP